MMGITKKAEIFVKRYFAGSRELTFSPIPFLTILLFNEYRPDVEFIVVF